MVTLAEFVTQLTDVNGTIALMERAISHIQRGGKAEPVSRWALGVIRQHVSGVGEEAAESSMRQGNGGLYDGQQRVMMSTVAPPAPVMSDAEWSIEQEFPSLENMFFGSVV